MKTRVNCPTCQTSVVWSTNNAYRPFCSKRCRLIDLGQWADEKYRIPTVEQPNMELDSDRFLDDNM